jgi:hypothetical protein
LLRFCGTAELDPLTALGVDLDSPRSALALVLRRVP